VDPVVQAPDYSQSYNGYSYCWNNPLKYTDPSGYLLDAESWQRSMYESRLRRSGVSQSDIWMMENNPYWETYFDTPYTTSYATGSSYYSNYSIIYGKQPENPHRFTSGYWVREYVDGNGNIIYPDGLSGMGYFPEITIVERFIPFPPGGEGMESARDPWWYEPADFLTTYLVGLDVLARLSGGLKEMPGCGQVGFAVQTVRSSHEILTGDSSIYPYADFSASFVGAFLGLGGFIGGINYLLMDKICGTEAFAEYFINAVSLYCEYGNPMFIRSWTH